jgi:hypothetical protein
MGIFELLNCCYFCFYFIAVFVNVMVNVIRFEVLSSISSIQIKDLIGSGETHQSVQDLNLHIEDVFTIVRVVHDVADVVNLAFFRGRCRG